MRCLNHSETRKNIARDAQEELQNNAQEEITRLGNTDEGRRAIDAGSAENKVVEVQLVVEEDQERIQSLKTWWKGSERSPTSSAK